MGAHVDPKQRVGLCRKKRRKKTINPVGVFLCHKDTKVIMDVSLPLDLIDQ